MASPGPGDRNWEYTYNFSLRSILIQISLNIIPKDQTDNK